ncbi:MAG: SDR family oxidoreductase [Bacteroidia bacterium]|nr:SDR family oxidoreductase [Bacteroidia bacterium]
MEFRSTVVWVTGASAGIGRATAGAFLNAGARVVASARTMERLEAAFEGVDNENLLLLPCDVADETAVQAAGQKIASQSGGVDILVNNAGTTVFRPFLSSTIEDFDTLHSTNLRGPFLCTQAVLPGMIEKGRGAVVMVSSMAAVHAFPDSSVYSAGKAGLKAMADCLRLEVRKSGIRVISVFPGATYTEIWPTRVLEKHGEKMMQPEDVASAIVHACSAPHGVMYEEIFMQPIGGGL